MKVVGIDPGFRNVGYVVVDLLTGRVEEPGHISTRKTAKASAAKDEKECSFQIFDELSRLFEKHKPLHVFAESLSVPRNSKTARQLGAGWGGISCALGAHDLGMTDLHPQTVRKLLGYPQSMSKTEYQEQVLSTLPSLRRLLETSGLAKGKWEHPIDAMCAVLAAFLTEEGKYMRKLARQKG